MAKRCLPGRRRLVSTCRNDPKLDVRSFTIAVDDSYAACVIFTEVDGLHDLSSLSLDLCRRSVNNDHTLCSWVIVQLDLIVVDTSLDVVVLKLAILVDQ